MGRVKEIYAIPMWLYGHAYLKPVKDYRDVRNPATGEILRRTPLFGPEVVAEAIHSAKGGLARWEAVGETGRKSMLSTLGNALYEMRAHFSRLIAEETGKSEESASRDVLNVVSKLCEPPVAEFAGVIVVSAGSRKLQEVAAQTIAALAGGAALVICPSPDSPSALLALAELSGRCGFPPGAVNVIFTGDEALAGLYVMPGVTVLN